MEIKQQCDAMINRKLVERLSDKVMVGSMNDLDPRLKFIPLNWLSPKLSMPPRPAGDDAQTIFGLWADGRAANIANGRRIGFILGPVTINDGARNLLDHGSNTSRNTAPGQPVDERIFKRFQASQSLGRSIDY